MSSDKSGKWWVGQQGDDLKEYLEAYSGDGYKVHEFRQARCACGSETFHLFADDNEGLCQAHLHDVRHESVHL